MGYEEVPRGEVKVWIHWLLIIIGLLCILAGLLSLSPELMKMVLPLELLQQIQVEAAARRVAALSGTGTAVHRLVYGLFAVIAGVGLFNRRSWAWGMATVILALIVVTAIMELVVNVLQRGRVQLLSIPWWVMVIAGIASIIAWPNLVNTRRFYTT